MIYLVTNNNKLKTCSEYKVISVKESLDILNTLNIIGVDTETTGLQHHSCQLLSLQLGCFDFQVVIDCLTVDPKDYKSLLESNKLLVFWNAKFDLQELYKYNIVPINIYDGMLAEKLMWLGYPRGIHSMSLKAAGENYLGVELDKSVRGKIIYMGLTPETIVYGATDVKYLEKIMNLQKDKLEEKGLTTAIDIENHFVLPLSYCEFCGVKLDVDKWKKKMEADKKREEEALQACNKWLLENEPDSPYIYIDSQGSLFDGFNLEPQISLNWNSAKQMIPIFKKYGVDVTVDDKKNGGTKDSIDAKQLKPQKSKCSLIPLYLEYREAVKTTSTYGENFLKQVNPETGRIYTNYTQLGADTTKQYSFI